MKHSTRSWILVMSLLSLLPSCGRIIDWGKDTLYQGEDLDDVTCIPSLYIRSVVAYDQLTTVAMFDALWLSDEVKTVYTNVHMLKCGKSEELRLAFLRRQLEENKHFITFYVLSSYRMPLGDPQSEWNLFLMLDDRCYTATEIKIVDLDPIYQAFFGKRFNQFKVAYRIKFDAKDVNDNLLINGTDQCMRLVFRGIKKEVSLVWHILPSGTVSDCEECNYCCSSDCPSEVLGDECDEDACDDAVMDEECDA